MYNKAATEPGDARTVDILIRENPGGIKVNEQFGISNGERFAPIERVTILRFKVLVDIFLRHGVGVTRTYREDGAGALDLTVDRVGRKVSDDELPIRPQIS